MTDKERTEMFEKLAAYVGKGKTSEAHAFLAGISKSYEHKDPIRDDGR